MTGHAALARANFETGCNCAQAVLCAYPGCCRARRP